MYIGKSMRAAASAFVFFLWCGSSTVAQEPGRHYQVGILVTGNAGTIQRYTVPELARQGFVEGKNLTIDVRSGPPASFSQLARDLVASRPDVIVAVSTLAGRAARRRQARFRLCSATEMIPSRRASFLR
jgi:ABC-type uncharacterized transport system substrate-binding protein